MNIDFVFSWAENEQGKMGSMLTTCPEVFNADASVLIVTNACLPVTVK